MKEVAQVSNVAAVRTHVSHVPASVSSGNCDISSFDVAMLDGIAKTCVCVGVCVSVCVCVFEKLRKPGVGLVSPGQ